MNNFEFPTNIKQVGSIGSGIKIYMEDYVCSYLQQYAASGGYHEMVAVLIGRQMKIDGQNVLFISGAIQGKDTVTEHGITMFSNKSWDYIGEEIEKHFSDMEVVGWMQSQPSYGTLLNPKYSAYHANNFQEPYQVMFVIDPIEKSNVFYIWDEGKGALTESRGYFIYYEKNDSMHEYMLLNRVGKNKIPSTPFEMNIDEFTEEVQKEQKPKLVGRIHNEKEGSATDAAERIKTVKRSIGGGSKFRRKRERGEPKRATNMLAVFSGVLVLVCFVMGTGLVQNEGRISQLENELVQLNTSYKNLMVQFSSTAEAFAPNTGTVNAGTVPEEENNEEPSELIREDGNEIINKPIEAEAASSSAPTNTAVPAVATITIPDIYVVEQGDSLSFISQKFYGSRDMVDKIMELNEMDNPDMIHYGKVLKLPRP